MANILKNLDELYIPEVDVRYGSGQKLSEIIVSPLWHWKEYESLCEAGYFLASIRCS